MAKRRTRITYAPNSRRKSNTYDRNASASSSNEQKKEENPVKSKSKRRSRIAYNPKGRGKASTIASSSAAVKAYLLSSSNEQEVKESPRRNKRRTRDSVTASLQEKKKKESSSSTEEKVTNKPSSSKQAGSEIKDKLSTASKKEGHKRKKRGKEDNEAPKNIKDMTISKTTYAKWRPLNPATNMYAKQVLESTILGVLNSVGRESKKKEVQVQLKKLSERIVTRLDSLKGPPHKEDYGTMESETGGLENAVISCNQQIKVLEKELDEQTRLLEEDEQMLDSHSEQAMEKQTQKKQLHPLLQKEPVNNLNLRSLSDDDDARKKPLVSQIPVSLENNGRRLAASLARMNDQAEQVGFTNWLEGVSMTRNALLSG